MREWLNEYTGLWFIGVLIIIVFFPSIYKILRRITIFLFDSLGNIAYSILHSPLENITQSKKKRMSTKIKDVNYKFNKEPEAFKLWDKEGKLRHPKYDPIISKHRKGNENYPGIKSKRDKKAAKLDMNYFTGRTYRYEYIVIGDRLNIETARKGAPLTIFEDSLVKLGYGYDGRPFGEPWGIDEACYKGYRYADQSGHFIYWNAGDERYKKYIQDGNTPPRDIDNSANRDIRRAAFNNIKPFQTGITGAINSQIYEQMKETLELKAYNSKYAKKNKAMNSSKNHKNLIKLDEVR